MEFGQDRHLEIFTCWWGLYGWHRLVGFLGTKSDFFYFLWRDTMTTANLTERTFSGGGFLHSFRGSVNCHHGMVQAGVVLLTSWSAGPRKLMGTHGHILIIGNLRVHPHSDIRTPTRTHTLQQSMKDVMRAIWCYLCLIVSSRTIPVTKCPEPRS